MRRHEHREYRFTIVSWHDVFGCDAAASAAPAHRARGGARTARRRRRVGADPSHRPDHQPRALPAVGLEGAAVHRTSSRAADLHRGGAGRGHHQRAGASRRRDQGARHPGNDGGRAHQGEPHRAAHRGREAGVGRDRDRHRRAVRRRGADHRHRRRARFTARAGHPVSPSERKILLAAGAAAGMAATFGAPLAAVVLAIELLLFEFSTRVFVPLVVAASIAGGMHSLLFGAGPAVQGADAPLRRPRACSRCSSLLGVGARPAGGAHRPGLVPVEDWYRRLPVEEFWHPVIGAVIFATIGIFVPRALGVGYDAISDVLANRLAVGTIAVLVLAQAARVVGGARVGHVRRHARADPPDQRRLRKPLRRGGATHLFPAIGVSPGAFAVVAMAATFGAATRATLTAMVFVFELTRDYNVILPLMLATVVADLVAGCAHARQHHDREAHATRLACPHRIRGRSLPHGSGRRRS